MNTTKQQSFKEKLNAINNYIRIKQSLPPTIFMNQQLITHMNRQKEEFIINNQLKFKIMEIALFTDCNSAVFRIENIRLDDSRRYCVNIIPSNTSISAELILYGGICDTNPTGKQKSQYFIKKSQAIVIKQNLWEKGILYLKATKVNKLSSAKIILDTIITQFKLKSNAFPSQKKLVKKQVEEYILKNYSKQKIKQIQQKRKRQSLTQIGTKSHSLLRRDPTISIISQSQRMIKTAQSKKQFINFENSKQKYLKHIQKMSPLKGEMIRHFKNDYEGQKTLTAQHLCKIIKISVFLQRINRLLIIESCKKLKKISIYFRCRKFMKKLTNATGKTRLSLINRNKLTYSLNVSAISTFLHQDSMNKSDDRIFECFRAISFKQSVLQIAYLSYRYRKAIAVIEQNYIKAQRIMRERFQLLVKHKNILFEDDFEKQECYNKYLERCRQIRKKVEKQKGSILSLKYFLVRNHSQIQIVLKKMRSS